jgi:hypothetical protein
MGNTQTKEFQDGVQSNHQPVVTKSEAAAILGVEEKSVTHVEGEVDGKNLCLKQVPGLYSRGDAEAIRAARDAKQAQAATEKAEKEEAAREPINRHEPAQGISDVEAAVKQAVAAGETSYTLSPAAPGNRADPRFPWAS